MNATLSALSVREYAKRNAMRRDATQTQTQNLFHVLPCSPSLSRDEARKTEHFPISALGTAANNAQRKIDF
jgi:hypothetical protein